MDAPSGEVGEERHAARTGDEVGGGYHELVLRRRNDGPHLRGKDVVPDSGGLLGRVGHNQGGGPGEVEAAAGEGAPDVVGQRGAVGGVPRRFVETHEPGPRLVERESLALREDRCLGGNGVGTVPVVVEARRCLPRSRAGGEHVEVVVVGVLPRGEILVGEIAATDDRHLVVEGHRLVVHPAIDPLEVDEAAEHPADVAAERIEEADICMFG